MLLNALQMLSRIKRWGQSSSDPHPHRIRLLLVLYFWDYASQVKDVSLLSQDYVVALQRCAQDLEEDYPVAWGFGRAVMQPEGKDRLQKALHEAHTWLIQVLMEQYDPQNDLHPYPKTEVNQLYGLCLAIGRFGMDVETHIEQIVKIAGMGDVVPAKVLQLIRP